MAENYRPIHERVPIIIKTCMVTGKIKACDAWISSPNKFVFWIRSQNGFLHHSPETSDSSKTRRMENFAGHRSMSKLKIARFNGECITEIWGIILWIWYPIFSINRFDVERIKNFKCVQHNPTVRKPDSRQPYLKRKSRREHFLVFYTRSSTFLWHAKHLWVFWKIGFH